MRETLASAPASTATAARTTGHAHRRGRARQVGEPSREWCAVVHRSETISGRLEKGVRGLGGEEREREAEMDKGMGSAEVWILIWLSWLRSGRG
jgi:hypothetical protein